MGMPAVRTVASADGGRWRVAVDGVAAGVDGVVEDGVDGVLWATNGSDTVAGAAGGAVVAVVVVVVAALAGGLRIAAAAAVAWLFSVAGSGT
jgi:hypothetical protein